MSRSSATTIRPSRNCTTPENRSSYRTRLHARSTKPSCCSRPVSYSVFPRTEVSGRNVARPACFCCKKRIHCLAAFSFSTIRFCMAPPNAVSSATPYFWSVVISCATVPNTPRGLPPSARRTALTLPPKPSMFRSISCSSLCRCRFSRRANAACSCCFLPASSACTA